MKHTTSAVIAQLEKTNAEYKIYKKGNGKINRCCI